MGLTSTSINDALSKVRSIGLDTAPIIYYIEANPAYDQLVMPVFDAIDDGRVTAYTSSISLLEVLVQPFKTSNPTLAGSYRTLLLSSPNIFVHDVDPPTATEAARLRAEYGLRTPDAIQVAVAILAGCDAFLTNDRRIKAVTEINVLLLDELTL